MSTWSCLEPKAAGLLGGEVAVRELEDRPSQGVLALFTQQSAALAWQRWWFYLLPQVQQNAPLSREATEVPRFVSRFGSVTSCTLRHTRSIIRHTKRLQPYVDLSLRAHTRGPLCCLCSSGGVCSNTHAYDARLDYSESPVPYQPQIAEARKRTSTRGRGLKPNILNVGSEH